MIGVLAEDDEKEVVEEFFELFKTSWEYYQEGKYYDVLLCSGELSGQENAALLILYGSSRKEADARFGIEWRGRRGIVELDWKGGRFPVFRGVSILKQEKSAFLRVCPSKEPCGVMLGNGAPLVARIGYDLFEEIEFLLRSRQPSGFALAPALEMHISILRELMIGSEISFTEIPPAPYGYDFIVCLTHDIDFAGIRNHKLDHTMFGFLYRALVKSGLDAARGKSGWEKAWKNLLAAFSLPAVHLGIVKDFWIQFDRYLELEKGMKSTFFFLPYKGVPGENEGGGAPLRRASKYDVGDLQGIVSGLISEGCEIGLHGIDAWHDPVKARSEAERISSVTGHRVKGVRMHWLYFAAASPGILEEAGLSYDSTMGYNDAVGFCAGTAQVFRPPGAQELLELPLTIQDTAMFYSGRMDLGEKEAFALCKDIIGKVGTFGGALVINWHDRSLGPERLWGDFYEGLLKEIKCYRVCSCTAFEATEWFRKRRAVRFTEVDGGDGTRRLKIERVEKGQGPGLKLRLYGDWDAGGEAKDSGKGYREMPLREDMELHVPPQRPRSPQR